MNKSILFTTLISASIFTNPAKAQSIADLAEQLALDKEKLTSLKATLREMLNGYILLQQDYSRIRDISASSFNLHKSYLDAMWVLSPNVRTDPSIDAIFGTESRFLAAYKQGTATLGTGRLFTIQELDYIITIYSTLLESCNQSIEELTMVTTDNQLRMTDAQRLQAIDRIDTETRGQLSAIQQLNMMLAIQTAQRQAASGDITTLKALYGLPQ